LEYAYIQNGNKIAWEMVDYLQEEMWWLHVAVTPLKLQQSFYNISIIYVHSNHFSVGYNYGCKSSQYIYEVLLDDINIKTMSYYINTKHWPKYFLGCGIAMASKVQLHCKTHGLMGMAIEIVTHVLEQEAHININVNINININDNTNINILTIILIYIILVLIY